MKYYAHIEVEIEAQDDDTANEIANEISAHTVNYFVFEVTDAWVANVE